MLSENRNVKQEPGAGRRRWFESDGLDLVVWLDAADRITGFQICYDFGRGEHALTWRAEGGFMHDAVDAGDETPLKNLSPILVPEGSAPWPRLLETFRERSAKLEPVLREFVESRLKRGTG